MTTDKNTGVSVRRSANPKWLSLSEAAEYLGVGTKFLTSRCMAGEVTFVRIGRNGCTRTGKYRFQVKWLDEYLERNTTYARTPPVRNYVRRRPLVTGEIFIDPRDCGNPFEE